MKLTKLDVAAIVEAEESQAIGYLGEGSQIHHNRATLLDYYNQKPYNDEIEGQSQTVSSDVADVVNGMLPNLMRMFTQSNQLGKFEANHPDHDDEAEQKTRYSNWVLFDQHDGVRILHDMLKDGILQYTGVVKVFHDDSKDTEVEQYRGVSEAELTHRLEPDENFEITDVENEEGGTLHVTGKRINARGRQCVENIPPDELLISKRARDFKEPPFIGQRTPKTRSDLIAMGFDKKTVQELGKDDKVSSEVKLSRNHDVEDQGFENNPTADKSKDVIYLGEYYLYIDMDGDGISELWQVFYTGQKVLEMNQVDEHPYAVFVPVPMPHKAIGTCPADQAADLQYLKSHLIRQANNNIYATNFNRVVANERVNMDDLVSQRHGSVVRIMGEGPIGDSVMPLMVNNQVPAVLEMISYIDSQIEKRTGVTSYNQGLDTESLNKTATGFQGIRDMSQMRIEQIAILASATIKTIFEKLVKLASNYQNEAIQTRLHGEAIEIDPREWTYKTQCKINVGTGAGDMQAKVANLNAMLQTQLALLDRQFGIIGADHVYATVKALAIESGLKTVDPYCADPTQPQEVLTAENYQLKKQMEALQMQMQNPLAEAEQRKGEFAMAKDQQKQAHEMNMEMAKMEQRDRYHEDEMFHKDTDTSIKLSELELKAKQDVKGSLI